jgi:hypothetical protein
MSVLFLNVVQAGAKHFTANLSDRLDNVEGGIAFERRG